ncbi:MAG: hypothetical protein AAGF47_06255 [Planctomycetota bacterium]
MRTAAVTLCFALLGGSPVLSGCQTKARLSRTNDELRLQRESLRERVDGLELQVAELRSKLAESLMAQPKAPPSDVIDALPRVASLRLTRFSAVAVDETDAEPVARLFVMPVDGRGRFVQATGSLSVRLVSPGAEGLEPSVLFERSLSPGELRDAYVVGLSGPSYRLDLPLGGGPLGSSIAVSVILADMVTGVLHEAETILPTQSAEGISAGVRSANSLTDDE